MLILRFLWLENAQYFILRFFPARIVRGEEEESKQ